MLFTPQSSIKKNSKKNTAVIKNTKSGVSVYNNFEYSDDRPIVVKTGIVLVQSNDPLSRLIQYITRQEYSLIGIYQKYEDSDDIHLRLFNILSGTTPYWLRDYTYLSDIDESKYIPKIVMYSTNVILEDNINPTDSSIKESLIYLFGNNIPMIQTIKSLISVLKINNPNTKSNKTNPIESIIESSNLIDVHSKCIIQSSPTKYVSNRFNKDRPYLSKVIATFIDMIISDSDFLDLVSEKYLNPIYSYDVLYDIVSNHIDNHQEIILFFQDFFDKGSIDKPRLDNLIDDINDIAAINEEIRTEEIRTENIIKIPLIPSKLIIVDKTPTPEITSTVNNLHEQLSRIVTTINNNKIPHIELNSMISSLNSISSYYNIKNEIPPITKPLSGIIVVSPEGEPPIPLTLKNKNQIILTTRNFDLSIFTRNELMEILEQIDKIANITDDRFDYLRNKITKEITKR